MNSIIKATAKCNTSLYIKAGPDGTSPGDCPFAHYVRMVLEEKNLPYDLFPKTRKNKPSWLLESYNGSLPALQHDDEVTIESDDIAKRIDSTIAPEPSLSSYTEEERALAAAALEGFFPSVARYLTHTGDGDDVDEERRGDLDRALGKLNAHLEGGGRSGPYLVGDGDHISLEDCALAPKIYHLEVCLGAFKKGKVDLEGNYPAVRRYADAVFGRESFRKTSYPRDFVVSGWSDARGK